MKISIITATYNSHKYISGVIDSFRGQSYPKIELIVIDGGSTDGTLEYLKQCNIVHHIISEPDSGLYDAMNKGIRLATGDIIGFLHSDDLLASPDTLNNIVAAFNCFKKGDREEVHGVYGNLIYVNQNNVKKIIRFWESSSLKSDSLIHGWMPAHPTLFLLREVYEKHGLFD